MGKNTEHLKAEHSELRRLWIENEGDIIELKSMLMRFFELKWYQRLFIKWDDWRLWLAMITMNKNGKKRTYNLGRYHSLPEALVAYRTASIKHFGEFARFE